VPEHKIVFRLLTNTQTTEIRSGQKKDFASNSLINRGAQRRKKIRGKQYPMFSVAQLPFKRAGAGPGVFDLSYQRKPRMSAIRDQKAM
jgi:hypothetical protein